MASRNNLDKCYMACAEAHSNLSYAERKKVGCALVTKHTTVVGACNGLPPPLGNECEVDGVTKDEVIHAENNALIKCAKDGISTIGSTVYVTLSPCKKCASMLISAGVVRVVYKEVYRDTSGIDLLKKANVEVEQHVDNIVGM